MFARLAGLRSLPGALAAVAGMTFISSLGISMMIPLLPLYGISLGATPVQLGLMTSAFAVANAIAQFGTGFFNDRFGPRRFIAAGIATYSVANGLIAGAPSAFALIGFRALAGLGSGANLVSARLYVSLVSPRERLSFSNAIISAAASAGNVAGPAIGGLLAAAFTLRAPFVAVAVTSAVAFIAALLLPRPHDEPTHEADRDVGAGGLLDRTVLVLLLSNFLILTAFGGWITSYAPFASERLGWSTFEIGLLFTIFAVGDITLGPWIGRLADRTGRRRVAIVSGFPVALFGFALVAEFPRLLLYATALLAGAGLTAFFSSWFALLTIAVPARRRGRVLGIVSAIGNLGTVVGSLAAAAIWQNVDLGIALLLASASALAATLALAALPTDRPSVESLPRRHEVVRESL